ncbi:hypothetical protein SH661x_003405 [Planctomicrobium sp. SH661]|uniref:hypothetical protein n=1 Tax=Planctomicrobium sp. SH661 TaxID=3448124 RepID=UPI003F5B8A11
MRTVVFCFEHLPACSLGCYGEWKIATPEFDALASRSLVWDQFIVPPVEGILLRELAAANPQAGLVADAPAPLASSSMFARTWDISPQTLGDISTFAELPGLNECQMLCIHHAAKELDVDDVTDAVNGWLQEDPVAHQQAVEQLEASTTDRWSRDELETLFAFLPAWQRRLICHAAEVRQSDRVLSHWLGLLEDVLTVGDVIVLTAASGDERRIPDDRPTWLKSVSEPVVHFPFIVHRVGDEVADNFEFLSLQQFSRLAASSFRNLSESFDWADTTFRSESASAVRTPSWLLVENLTGAQSSAVDAASDPEIQLFRKPEDFWDVNDVASQHPDLIDYYRQHGRLPVNQ